MKRLPGLPCNAALVLALLAATSSPGAAQETPDEAAQTTSYPTGYFRFDYDSYGLQLWAGATHLIGGVEIASDVYVTDSFGEVDIGPQFRIGDFTLIATVGPVYDFASQSVMAIVAPLLTSIHDGPKVYIESWLQFTFASPFADGAEDLFHTRNFILYKINESLWLGPQLELDYGMAQADAVLSLPVGGQLSVGYGKDNRLSLFLGYETEVQMDGDGVPVDSDRLAGRVTFVRLW